LSFHKTRHKVGKTYEREGAKMWGKKTVQTCLRLSYTGETGKKDTGYQEKGKVRNPPFEELGKKTGQKKGGTIPSERARH